MNKKQLSNLEDYYCLEDDVPFIITDVEYIKNDYLTIQERFGENV